MITRNDCPILFIVLATLCLNLFISIIPVYCAEKPPYLGATPFYKEMTFDRSDRLVISGERNAEVSVTFFQGKSLIWRLTIGNAVITDEDIKELELDRTNDAKEFLIEIRDRTSNFGAVTGIIVYKRVWWEFLQIPDAVFDLIYNNKEEIYEIRMNGVQHKTVILKNGLLIPKKK